MSNDEDRAALNAYVKSLGPVSAEDRDWLVAQWAKDNLTPALSRDNEQQTMRQLADFIAASCCPSEDARLEVAYAIARHLKLGWPAAETSGDVERDAMRYRYLRMCDWFDSPLCVLRDPKKAIDERLMLGADCPSRERLDAFIDATITATKE